MPAKLAEADQMTIEEFLAFTDQRPDGERWELVEGMAIMNASPSDWHQAIAGNLLDALRAHRKSTGAGWYPLMGIGTRVPVSPNSLPQPDIFVKEHQMVGKGVTDDAVMIFEVLSKSNSKADQAWRRRVYASIPNCQHYVTVSMSSAEVTRYDRDANWSPVVSRGLASVLDLPAIGLEIPLRDIYDWTPIE